MIEEYEKRRIMKILSNIKRAETNSLSNVMRLTFFSSKQYTDTEGINILNGLSTLQYQDELNYPINSEGYLSKNKQENYFTPIHETKNNNNNNNNNEQFNIIQKNGNQIDTTLKQLISDCEMDELISHIGECYRSQETRNKSNKNVQFDTSYLTYLLEIQQNFKLFWKQYCYEIWGNKSITLKREQIMYSMLHRFQNTVKSIQKQEKADECIFNVNYLNVIMFDESIKEAFSLLNECIQKKTGVLQMMQLREIDLNELSQKIEELQSLTQKLKLNINFLSKLNSNNHEFKLLNTYFRNFLSFSRFDVSSHDKTQHKKRKSSQDGQDKNYYQSRYGSSVADIQDLQNKNSCVIFTSLLNQSAQTIKRTSFNFSKIFKMKSQLAINKPIEILMPTAFQAAHPKYIKEFMESKNVFTNKIQNVVFGIKQDGYIFPCTVNVKVNKIDLFSDFGMTTLIKMINLNKDYILFNQNNLRVISITNNIHRYIFKSFKKFSTILIDKYFPFINQKLLKIQEESIKNLDDSLHSQEAEGSPDQNLANFLFQQFQFVFIEDNSVTELVKCHQHSVLDNVQFFLIDIVIKKAQYKYINNVYYIEIAQLQELDTEKDYKLILQQFDSFLYASKQNSPIFKKIVRQLKLIEQLSDDLQDNPFSIDNGSPRAVFSSLLLKDHAKSSQQIDINSPSLKYKKKSKNDSCEKEAQNISQLNNDNRVFSIENLIESQSTSRECQLVNLSKRLRGVHSALQVFTSIHERIKPINQTQNTPRSLINITQNYNTDNQKLILSTKEEDKNMQKIKLFKSIKQPININNESHFQIPEKQSQIDFSVINTLGLNNSLSIDAGDDLITINSFDEQDHDIQEERQAQMEQMIEKEEKIRQSRSTVRYIQDIMDQKIELKSIKIFQIIAFCSFIAIFSLTISQFAELVTSVDNYQLDFKLVHWPTLFESEMANVQKNISLKQLIQKKDFSLVTDSQRNEMNTQINSYLSTADQEIHTIMSKMENINSNRPIFHFLKEQPVVYTWPSFKYTGMNSLGKFFEIRYDTELHYGIILINLQILRYIADAGGGRPEYFMMVNQIEFFEAFKQVQEKAINQSDQSLIQIRDRLDTMLIITLVVTTFCLGIQLPIYNFIQKERQAILCLFVTFSTSITSKILSRINSIYQSNSTSVGLSTVIFAKNNNNNNLVNDNYQLNGMSHIHPTRKQDENNDQKIKKQNMSDYKDLSRLEAPFIKKILIIYILIIIYPILNKVISTQYINQSIRDVKNMVQVYQLKAQILESIGMNYYSMILKLYPNQKPMKIEWYLDRLNQIITANLEFDQKIREVTNLQRDQYNFKKEEYNKVFFPLIEGDICETLESQGQFASNEEADKCIKYYNNVLTQGVILSFRKLTDQLQEFLNIYQLSITSDEYLKKKKQLLQSFNLYEFNQFSLILTKSIDYLREFIIKTNDDYYQFLLLFQSISLAYQLIVIFIFFFIEQIIFYHSINKKINQTKRYLQIIDIKSLLSNPFIINYFKKNIKK